MGYEFNVPTTILGSTSVSRTSKRKVAVVWRPAWASNPKYDFEIHGTEDFLHGFASMQEHGHRPDAF